MEAVELEIHGFDVGKLEHIRNNLLLAKHSISVLFSSLTCRFLYPFLITAPF